MKFPLNIVLDVSKNSLKNSSYHWFTRFLIIILKNETKLSNFNNFFLNKTFKFRLVTNFKFYTLKYKTINNNKINFLVFPAKFIYESTILWKKFDINFLKKERIYTKLKYSRVPQYDIVSGGSAALFAGFLGFLISEKFGLELADSGDFYFLFMYLVFFFFACRIYLKIINSEVHSWNILSFKWLLYYINSIFNFLLNIFKIK